MRIYIFQSLKVIFNLNGNKFNHNDLFFSELSLKQWKLLPLIQKWFITMIPILTLKWHKILLSKYS